MSVYLLPTVLIYDYIGHGHLFSYYHFQFSYSNISSIFSFLSPMGSHSLKFYPFLDVIFADWFLGGLDSAV